MNKKILIASAVALASSLSFGLTTWYGTDGEYQITTGVDVEGDGGYWYYYDDSGDGGNSTLTWPQELGNDYSSDAMDPVIDACGGLCGQVVIGTDYDYGYIGIGFNLGGGSQPQTDVTSWGGVDLCYISDVKFGIELGNDDQTEYDNYHTQLKAASSVTLAQAAWSDFSQEGWGTSIDISTATSTMTALKFKISKSWGAKAGTAYFINLVGVGEYQAISSCPTSGVATTFSAAGGSSSSPIASSAKASSSVKAMLSGRTLSFSGVNSAARAEIINLQGQVVMNSTVSGASSLNLSSLNSGVYMVRLAGQGVNYTQRITLK